MSYAADRSPKAVPVIFPTCSHTLCVESDSTIDLYMIFRSKAGLFLDEVFFDGKRYSVHDQSSV